MLLASFFLGETAHDIKISHYFNSDLVLCVLPLPL